jgi:hypothetical protein
LGEPQSKAGSPLNFSPGDEEGKEEGKQDLDNQDEMKVLPFEFVALEACLEAACSCLEIEVKIHYFLFLLLFCFVHFLFTITCFLLYLFSKSGYDIGAGGSSSLR